MFPHHKKCNILFNVLLLARINSTLFWIRRIPVEKCYKSKGQKLTTYCCNRNVSKLFMAFQLLGGIVAAWKSQIFGTHSKNQMSTVAGEAC